MIRIVKFTLAFGKRFLFKGFQAQFPASGLFGIIGASGSGKTTLFKAIMGLQSFQGLISIQGTNMGSLSGLALQTFRRKTFGWIDQDFTLFLTMTVEENLMILARIKGFELDRDARLEVSHAIRTLQLESFRTRLLGSLSGGQRQRIALAAALIGRPPILIADEPFSHLDIEQEKMALSWLKEISTHHLILLSSHHTATLQSYCDQTFLLTPNANIAVASSNNQSSFTHPRRSPILPFRAVWTLIQSMALGKTIARFLEFMSVSLILILATLAMILRMVSLQIQTEIETRLGDGLTTIHLRQNELPPFQNISLSKLDHFRNSFSSLNMQWGVMGNLEIEKLEHHQLYVQSGQYQLALPDFDLHAYFNMKFTFETPNVNAIPMDLFELSLGLNAFQYEWAQLVFKTSDLKMYLKTQTPRLLLKVAQSLWHYEDEVGFDWVDVELTATPMIIHSDPMFIQSLFHHHMQIPIQEANNPSPMQLNLSPFVWLPNHDEKKRIQNVLSQQGVLLDRIQFGQHRSCPLEQPCLLDRYFLFEKPYDLPESWLKLQRTFLPLSIGGLMRIEEAYLYGFQKKMYMSLSRPLLEQVQDMTFREKEDRASTLFSSPGLWASYVYAPSSRPVIWKPSTLKGGVTLSLAWKDQAHQLESIYFLYEFLKIPLGDGYIQTTYRLASLPILGWTTSSLHTISIHHDTLQDLLVDLLEQSSMHVYPFGFVVEEFLHAEKLTLPWYRSTTLMQSQSQTEQWIQWITLGSLGLGVVTSLPLVGLLLMLYDLKAQPLKTQGTILMHHGLAKEAIIQVFQLDMVFTILRWWFPILIGLFSISYVITLILGDLFISAVAYIPWLESLWVTLGLFVLMMMVTERFRRQFK